MTTVAKLPVNDEDCIDLDKIGDHVPDASDPGPVMAGPSGKATVKCVSGVRRLSAISEREPDKPGTEPWSRGPLAGSECGGSSFSLCSDKFRNISSRLSSDDSYQPGTGGDDCAALLLACLHCRFHELMVLLPAACERAVSRCFPSYKHIAASSERDQQGKDCCSCQLELDCNFCGSCQDAGELIELAMEISEICYR